MEKVAFSEGIECRIEGNDLVCIKGQDKVTKKILIPRLKAEVDNKENKIILSYDKGGKRERANLLAISAHIRNLFSGLNEKFVYEMEVCNVHFPMTIKIEGHKLVISNFLGEKEKRTANIIEGVNVEIKGNKVLVSSANIERAGQTAANIEKATWIPRRDRRVFQDGIFITKKPREGV